MGKIHKHNVLYENIVVDNLYQYLLNRFPINEYDHYPKLLPYNSVCETILNSTERYNLLATKSKDPKPMDYKIPYLVIKIDDRAKESLTKLHQILDLDFVYHNDINYVDARKDDVSNFLKDRNIKINWLGDLFGLSKDYSIGELGTFCSHIKALEYIVENNIEECVVFEDDVIISDDFLINFKNFYEDLPKDYDFVSDSSFFPNYEEVSTNKETIITNSPYLSRPYLQNAYCVFMLYSLNGAKKILNLIKRYGFIANIDTSIFFYHRRQDLIGYSTYYENRLVETAHLYGSFARSSDHKKILIFAGGPDTRWNNHLGIPRHMVEVDDEPIIHRIQRLLLEKGASNIIVCCNEENKDQYVLAGCDFAVSPKCVGDIYEDAYAWHYKDYLNYSGTTIILYGDCYYSENLIETILEDNGHIWHMYGRYGSSKITGKAYSEQFAWVIGKESINNLVEKSRIACGMPAKFGWGSEQTDHIVYRLLAGLDPKSNQKEDIHWYNWDDETDDFDYPEDVNILSKIYNIKNV